MSRSYYDDEEEDDMANIKFGVAWEKTKGFAISTLWPLLKLAKPYLRRVVDETLIPELGKVIKDKKTLDLVKQVIDDIVNAI